MKKIKNKNSNPIVVFCKKMYNKLEQNNYIGEGGKFTCLGLAQ